MIDSLDRRGGAEEVSPPTRDALTPPPLPNLTYLHSIFASYCHACLPLSCMPPTAIHVSHCHACLLLPCMPSTAMHASYCHACLLLPCMPPTAMHASYCHACLLLPCMLPTAMHASHCHACQDIPTPTALFIINNFKNLSVSFL
jgi:hypothetical protein